jgi:chromosome segregation ATPase
MKDDIANGKVNNIQKQFVDENRKLKKAETELQEKYDKLLKQYEEIKAKGSKPKIQTKASQIQILQTELHQKQLQLEKIQHNFHNKIEKYKKIMKNEEEDVLVTSWEDWFSKINKKLVLYKKENLSSTEINQVKVVSFIIQELVTLAPEYLMFILDRARTVPEELMEKIHILEQKLDSCTLERNNLENQLNQASEDKTNFAQKFEAQDQECHKLKEEITNLNVKIHESGEIKQSSQSENDKEKDHDKEKDKEKR